MIEALYKFLGSVGYTDPIHAPVTHMPVGLAIGAFIFFVVAIIFKRQQLVITARHVSILALLFAFPTILFGVFDWIHFYHGVLLPAIKIKMVLAGSLVVLLGIGVILGSEVKLHSLWMTIIYALCVGMVVALGWFGAGLIYGRGAAAAASAPAPAPAQSSAAKPAVAGDVKAGQALFADNCQACHSNGQNVIVPELPIRGSKRLATLTGFVAFIRSPSMPDGSAGQMPPFPADTISDAQATDLYAYVTTAWK
ncbi:MAG TPA: c-type cytochrome [Rectinemataceae bacterium]|nr:c-type cytochrome [Rectinemataceae bacterium]